MPPRASRCCPLRRPERGVLLVEAVLSAVVIAVGLSFITRALGGQLKALQGIEEYTVLAELAQQAMRTHEAQVQAGQLPRGLREGTFGEPYAAYEWTLSAAALNDPDLAVPVSRVTLSVRRSDHPASRFSVQAVWPTSLVPPEWFSS